MPYTSVAIPTFGGLDLQHDPEEVGATGATDMLNADLDQPGRVRSRDGLTALSAAVASLSSSIGVDILPVNLGSNALAVVSGTGTVVLRTVATNGTVTSVGSWATSVYRSMVQYGTPTSALLFIASSTNIAEGSQTLRKYDGTTLTTSTGSPRHIDVTPSSNRLVQAGFATAAGSPTGANGSKYTVFFSDAGAPETYSANNYVHLDPGDGDQIEAVKRWRELLFVFKSRCFYVFYNESTDGTGNPIFNYRRVNLEGQLYATGTSSYGCSVVAGNDGVYFATTKGVYRTTGGPGQLVSEAITPVFTDLSHALHINELRSLSFGKGRLYMTIEGPSSLERTFVYDPASGAWMLWSLPANPSRVVDWRTGASKSGDEERVYLVANNKVSYLSGTTDDGVAIPSSYTSGIYDLGAPGHVTDTRWTRLWGYGSPTVSVFTDHGSSDSRAAAVTTGTFPAVVEGYHLQAYSGQMFQHKLSAASGAWGVNRLLHDVAWVRP